MRHPYTTNAQRLASAQTMLDRATDDRTDDFIDTLEGQAWLENAADELASGINQTWRHGANSQLQGVTYAELEQAIIDRECSEWRVACDAFLVATLRNKDDDRQALELAQSELRKAAKRIAFDLLCPHAQDWADYQDAMMECDQ